MVFVFFIFVFTLLFGAGIARSVCVPPSALTSCERVINGCVLASHHPPNPTHTENKPPNPNPATRPASTTAPFALVLCLCVCVSLSVCRCVCTRIMVDLVIAAIPNRLAQ